MDFTSSIGRSGGIGNHDDLKGHGIGSVSPGMSGVGVQRPMYNKAITPEKEEDIYIADEDDELFVRDEIRNKLKSIIFPDQLTSINMEPQRSDMNSMSGPGLRLEFTHTTTARDTISPFSHKQLYPNGLEQPLGTGGSNQIFKTGNYKPIGSEAGWVAPGTVMEDDDEPLYDMRNIDDPMERAFKKHQKSVKLLLNKINECLKDI